MHQGVFFTLVCGFQIFLIFVAQVLPCYWALLTLLLSCAGPFGSEGKMFQRMGKPHQENQETKRWLPLPADPTPRAEKDSELPKHLTLAEQIPTKRPRDADLLPWKKYEQDGILKRRHGFSQVDIHPQFYCFCPRSRI